jgi:hypothetical protein
VSDRASGAGKPLDKVPAAANTDCSTTPSDAEALAALRTLRAWLGGAAPAVDTTITTANVESEFPGVTARVFADAGRRGEFTARKQGRKLAALRSDVEAWLERRSVTPRPRKARLVTIDPAAEYAAMAGAR